MYMGWYGVVVADLLGWYGVVWGVQFMFSIRHTWSVWDWLLV